MAASAQREFTRAGLEIADLVRVNRLTVTETDPESFAPRFSGLPSITLGLQ